MTAPAMPEGAIGDDAVVAFAGLGGWPGVLGELMAGRDLETATASAAMGEVLSGRATPAQIAAFMVALRAKGETATEMGGLVAAMMAHAERVEVPDADRLIDTCGTGGDRMGTINVSTIAAFVAAGAGARVAKHGNRAASSQTGSADVLAALGVAIDLGPGGVAACIEEAGIGYMFAPRFHPAMRHAGPVRAELGVRTVFNFLGPLANPAGVTRQIVGVSDPAMAERMREVLRARGCRRAMVVHGHDGLDELSTTGPSTVLELEVGGEGHAAAGAAAGAAGAAGAAAGSAGEAGDGPAAAGGVVERSYKIEPAELGFAPATVESLRGGDAAANAEAARRVLGGEEGPHRDLVVLNAAAALVVAGIATAMAEGVELAAASIDTGRAAGALAALVQVSQREKASQG